MKQITLEPAQLEYVIQRIGEPSLLDWINVGLGLLTIGALIATLILQMRTTKLIVKESRIKLMPYFDLFNRSINGHLSRLIRANKSMAFDIVVTPVGNGATHLKSHFFEERTDIIAPGEYFTELMLSETSILLLFGASPDKHHKEELFKIQFSDIEGRRYSQVFYARNNWIHVTKPIEENVNPSA